MDTFMASFQGASADRRQVRDARTRQQARAPSPSAAFGKIAALGKAAPGPEAEGLGVGPRARVR